mmetsp:Transcript_46856/g.135011  ORF Transcript_46856/g.135011 Transcript_46856/m.135011 type:complete len:202 (-) Transcript_46856:559-1164(-)
MGLPCRRHDSLEELLRCRQDAEVRDHRLLVWLLHSLQLPCPGGADARQLPHRRAVQRRHGPFGVEDYLRDASAHPLLAAHPHDRLRDAHLLLNGRGDTRPRHIEGVYLHAHQGRHEFHRGRLRGVLLKAAKRHSLPRAGLVHPQLQGSGVLGDELHPSAPPLPSVGLQTRLGLPRHELRRRVGFASQPWRHDRLRRRCQSV